MSRSPLSPAGKRMRTMEDSSDSDSDDEVVEPRLLGKYRAELYHWSDETGGFRLYAGLESGSNGGERNFHSIEERSEGEGDIQANNVAERNRQVEEEDTDYSRDSLSSGYDDIEPIDLHEDIQAALQEDAEEEGSSLDYDSDDDEDIDQCPAEEYLVFDPTPKNHYPKPDWITVNELRERRCGFSRSKRITRSNMYWFERNVNNSLWMIQRLELSKRLEEHTGCVNSLDFNSKGNLLCSGSDDLSVCIWDWQSNKLTKKINSGHVNNVVQSQFCNSDANIITTSRDGTVRLLNIETNLSELLLSQSGEIGEIAFITPQTLVTCGTNAYVNFIDLRVKDPLKLFIVRNPKNNRSCELHTINSHPLDTHKIVVAGASPYVFLYDLRLIARDINEKEHKPALCLDKFEDSNHIVTSTAFNSLGDSLLISYNDDDLYVCRTDTLEIIHQYKGHRNKRTIKGCTWFGDKYVLSGSDDGHIYGWDLESEHIVCFLEGDLKGIVNCLRVHPNMPVLASSGLDHNVKVWEPTSKTWPQTLKGIKPQICKNAMRRKRAQDRRNQDVIIMDGSDMDMRYL